MHHLIIMNLLEKRVIYIIELWLVFNILQCDAQKQSNEEPTRTKLFYKKAPIPKFNGSEDYLLHTDGCKIPNYAKTMYYHEPIEYKIPCDKRLVFVTKTSEEEVTFKIDYESIKTKKKRFKCCYKYAKRSTTPGHEDNFLRFSKCKRFKHGQVINLDAEIITVSCGLHYAERNFTVLVYKDAYLILKKQPTPTETIKNKNKWNVLLLGMDSMSRGRAFNSLPKVVQYMQEQEWLDYRGYNKVEYNTFPNLMSILTGKHPLAISEMCGTGVEKCRNILIWNKFKEAGYMTAFGEEAKTGTFTPYYGFRFPPTDHYARPFFTIKDYTRGNIICTRAKSSGLRLLNYAKQFVEAYKKDSFFGFFWLSYFSHDANNLPKTSENMLLYFFSYLQDIGVLKNTFIIFLSDHGLNYGKNNVLRESYYDSRLPMLFMWVPLKFRRLHKEKYYNMQMNQNRLTTPFDLHGTLYTILKMANDKIKIVPSEACPRCEGFFKQISKKRSCKDVNIDEVWCSCHEMNETSKSGKYHKPSVAAAISYVQKTAMAVKTVECSKCAPLKLKQVIRNDWYKHGNRQYFVIALSVDPMNLGYEVIIKKIDNNYNVLNARTISPYNPKSNCVTDSYIGKGFCVCTYHC